MLSFQAITKMKDSIFSILNTLKKYALKHFNRLLRDNSYEVLKENAINNEYESLSGCISGTNLEVRSIMPNKVMFSQDEKEMLLPYDSLHKWFMY